MTWKPIHNDSPNIAHIKSCIAELESELEFLRTQLATEDARIPEPEEHDRMVLMAAWERLAWRRFVTPSQPSEAPAGVWGTACPTVGSVFSLDAETRTEIQRRKDGE